MPQIISAATKKFDTKPFINNVKKFITEAILTDTGMITVLALVVTLTGLMLMQSAMSQSDEAKSVAWYVSNIKTAQIKNNECHRANNSLELQSTPDCINALHAIEISFK
jgi:hypothetical protein